MSFGYSAIGTWDEPDPDAPHRGDRDLQPNTLSAFISYCRTDSEFALRLAEDLKESGAAVWLDQIDIIPGAPWDVAVENALNLCGCLLVILSPQAVASANVLDEVSFALRSEKRIIPVLYRECKIPLRLHRLQHLDFSRDYDRGFKILAKALEAQSREGAAAHAVQQTNLKEKRSDTDEADQERLWKIWKNVDRSIYPRIDPGNTPHTGHSGPAWKVVTQFKHPTLTGVTFANSQMGWAVGDDGTILHSDDGGVTWKPQASGTQIFLRAVAFTSPQSGWVVGGKGTILHTKNGGITWISQSVDTDQAFLGVAFATLESGWAVGTGGMIWHTADQGATWKQQVSGTDSVLECVAVISPQSGWVAGQDGVILHTEDGGATWKQQDSGIDPMNLRCNFESVAFPTPLSGWAVGNDGIIVHTENGGETWNRQTLEPVVSFPWFQSVAFSTHRAGWAIDLGGTLWNTEDGVHWKRHIRDQNVNLYGVTASPFLDSVWAVGRSGQILRFNFQSARTGPSSDDPA
jgi:photosystem II stability/assembly factor-like uncharacterized protein